MDELVELGRTAGAYGFRGWVRVIPHQSGEVLKKAKNWVITDLKGNTMSVKVEAIRRHGEGFVAKWEGCESKEAADAARGRISVARSDFPEAGKNEVWAVDLIDCKVVNKEGIELGKVSSIGSNGAQDLFFIDYLNEDGKPASFMVPIVKDVYLIGVDLDSKTVTVDWQPEWR